MCLTARDRKCSYSQQNAGTLRLHGLALQYDAEKGRREQGTKTHGNITQKMERSEPIKSIIQTALGILLVKITSLCISSLNP